MFRSNYFFVRYVYKLVRKRLTLNLSLREKWEGHHQKSHLKNMDHKLVKQMLEDPSN